MFNSKLIRKKREENNWSKQDILNLLLTDYDFRVSRPTYDSWENGLVVPSADDVEVLADLFKVKIDKFFIDKD